jgi:hypothetical protein
MTKHIGEQQNTLCEKYWKHRQEEDYLYTTDKVFSPRIQVTLDMFLRGFDLNGSEPKKCS